MKGASELKRILGQYLPWNKARLDCFARMVLGMIAVRTVNLSEIAVAFPSQAEVASRYKRLQRFFALFHMDLSQLARWMFSLFFSASDKLYLCIDRTNWYWGKSKINVLMLSIAYEGLAIPIFWTLLPKAGNSSFDEQRKLINRFIKAFGKEVIVGLLADREFGSHKLFSWLSKEKIPFYIRIKEGTQVRVFAKQKAWTAKKLFSAVSPKQTDYYINNLIVFDTQVRLAAGRSETGELLIVATNADVKHAVPVYLRRWEIESLFQSLKNRGFRFESTHMTKKDRIEKLMAVMAFAFCWAHKIGEWRALKKPIPMKKFKRQWRPQFSYFRYGLDFIRQILFNASSAKKLTPLIKKLKPPPPSQNLHLGALP